MRATQHSGRTNSQGKAYTTKHNDRSFDSEAENIDKTKSKNNTYWSCYDVPTFEEAEKKFYEYKFRETLERTNQKYKDKRQYKRIKTMDEWRASKMHCPEEVILQIGKMEEQIAPELFRECVSDYIKELNKYCGNNMTILNYAIHEDEAVPHCHIRRVWHYEKDGLMTTGQEQALKQLGVELPNEQEARSRNNNRKMTFDAKMRAKWLDICESRGIKVEREPVPDAKHNRTKEQLIRDKLEYNINQNKMLEKAQDDIINIISDKQSELNSLEQKKDLKQKELNSLEQKNELKQKELDSFTKELDEKGKELKDLIGDLIKQRDLPKREPDKTLLGKNKDTVTVSVQEYNSLQRYASVSDDVLEARRRANKQAEDNLRQFITLEQEKALYEAKLEQIRTKEIETDRNYELSCYYQNQYESAEEDITKLSDELKKSQEQLAKSNESNKSLAGRLNEYSHFENDFTFMQWLASLLKDVWEQLKLLFKLEDVLKDPECEQSLQGRKVKNLYGHSECPEPYARWSSLNNNYQYYWKGGNGSRTDMLINAYFPLTQEIAEYDKQLAVKVTDADLLNEVFEDNLQNNNRGFTR